MKLNIIITLSILDFLIVGQSIAQDKKPIVISPLIGEKLDKVERDYFGLFLGFNGFQEAEFYLNPDSTLKVHINYNKGEELKDTIISEYRSLKKMHYYFINFMKNSIEDISEEEKGRTIDVNDNYGEKTNGELLYAADSSLFIYNQSFINIYSSNQTLKSYGILNIINNNINDVRIKSGTNIAPYIYGSLGGIIGGIIGAAVDKNNPPAPGKFITINLHTEIYLGAALGILVGYVLGYALPIEIVSGKVYQNPFDENDIEGLRSNARYKQDIPYFMLKVIRTDN